MFDSVPCVKHLNCQDVRVILFESTPISHT